MNALGLCRQRVAEWRETRDAGPSGASKRMRPLVKQIAPERATPTPAPRQEKLIKSRRRGHALRPLPTASPLS
jgi:hypothetical protein